jgi:hypothetical protein
MDSFKEVYCQTCGREILDLAYVSDVKRVYHPVSKCVPKITQEDNTLEVRNKEEIQQDIKEGKLIHYGKLERAFFR